jgi:copper chaperone CopZ
MSVTKTILQLEGMHCSACAMNIDFDVEDLAGVQSVKTSYARQECEVTYDSSLVSIDQIIDQINQTGYKATVRS